MQREVGARIVSLRSLWIDLFDSGFYTQSKSIFMGAIRRIATFARIVRITEIQNGDQ